ncbi:MAG: glycosyltransferase family 2 protein [Nitrospirota bacterium]
MERPVEASSVDIRLSVVVPAFNEAEALSEFHRRLSNVLQSMGVKAEIVYVNDGSTDDTLAVMEALREKEPGIAIIDLSRNFGKEIALTAGLDYAKGDAIIVIDADLQDPPELIPELVKQWEMGYDVVYAKRVKRHGEGILKKITAHTFYRLIRKVSKVKIPRDAGDFRLLSRRAVNSLKLLREHHRFMKGLFTWIGYPQKEIPYQRDPRYAGKTKWNYWRLWNFALEGFTSFTIAPLKIASYFGLVIAFMAFLYALFIIYKTLVYGEPVRGYPSLMVVILFLGGVQLIAIGVIGEYIGRIFNETKQRPLYLVKSYIPSKKS